MARRSTSRTSVDATHALACLCLVACAAETRERPPDHALTGSPRGQPASALAPLPFPSTAFQADGTPPPASATTARPSTQDGASRFDTRRIGASDGDDRPRYRGARIDLDLKNAELAEVFRLLSDVGHVNIVIAGDVTGTVTMRLRQVPWDQALETVARAKGLALERDGSVIVVHAAGK